MKISAPFAIDHSLRAEDYKDVFRDIYRSGYFTNHGPMAREFERRLECFLGIGNVVTVGNESLALLIALAGLDIKGEVLMPLNYDSIVPDIVAWSGLETRICGDDLETDQVSVKTLIAAMRETTKAVILTETPTTRTDGQIVNSLTARNIKVIILAFDLIGSYVDRRCVTNDPNLVTVYSFGPNRVPTTLQGGAIATSCDELAHRFRNIRSSYGVREPRDVVATCNGRFSEFQAGLGLKGLKRLVQQQRDIHVVAESYHSTTLPL